MNPPAERWSNRALVRLVWPLMIEQLLAATIGMVDTVMVTSVGESAVSGVSLVDSINILLIMMFSALATGGAVVASQYLGRRERHNASVAAKQLVYSITAFSLLLMALVLALRQPILRLVFGHIEPDVMRNADTYFWLSAISYPFLALYNSGAALFRSMGNSRVSMWTALLVNLLNIIGNTLLIYVLNLGVAGAAISTLVSRAIAGIVIIRLLMSQRAGQITLQGLFRIRLRWDMIKSILKIGLPNGLENSMFQIGKLLVARLISTFGTAAIAGNAIASIIASIINIPGQAIGLALLTVVGQCVGAADFTGARKYTRKLMLVAYGAMVSLCLVVFLVMNPLLGLFNLSEPARQVAAGCIMLFCACTGPFWPQSFALPNALRAAGDARYTMVVSVLSMWIFRIGFSFLFANWLGFGVLGVWIAMVVDWVVRGIFFLLRWRSGKWQAHKVI